MSVILRRSLATGVVLLSAAAGCSSDSEPPASESEQTALAAVDSPVDDGVDDIAGQALVAGIRAAEDRYPTFSRYPDEGIVKVGALVCSGFDDGVSFASAVDAVTEGAGADVVEAISFVGLAVGEICPEHAGEVG